MVPVIRSRFINTHLDNLSADDRLQGAKDIELIMDTLPARPALVGGDLNDLPGSDTMIEFQKDWVLDNLGLQRFTYPSHNPEKHIDYMLHRDSSRWILKSMTVINESFISDHLPVVYVYELLAEE